VLYVRTEKDEILRTLVKSSKGKRQKLRDTKENLIKLDIRDGHMKNRENFWTKRELIEPEIHLGDLINY
jgi:hypothetical protein